MNIVQQGGPQGPRFSVSLSDVSAFGGNPALIDVAAKLLNVGRVEVPGPDGNWFAAAGLTDRGKAALQAFEAAGVVLQFNNPSPRLLNSLLEHAKKGFIVTGTTTIPDAALAKKIAEKNVLWAVEFDAASPETVAARLIDLKKTFGASANLLLTTQERVATSPMGDTASSPRQTLLDGAKQKMYLALIKGGWTKDEIYSMAGVSPAVAGRPQMPGGPGPTRLPGNLGKLSQ